MSCAPGIEVIPFHSSKAEAEIKRLQANPPIVFAGSGVSIWHPTGLPSGKAFAQSMYAILFKSGFDLSAEEDAILESLFNGLPFEHLLELSPSKDKAHALLTKLYDCSIANPVHDALSAAFRDGRVSQIITTNYDCGFEAAFVKLRSFEYNIVRTDEDAFGDSAAAHSKYFFKIHGSVGGPSGAKLLFTLTDEGLLPKWKRTLLKKLLSNQPCLFLGYSGLDFDLCPVVARIPGVRIVWVDRAECPPSTNANALIRQLDGSYIKAEMLEFLHGWLGHVGATNCSMKEVDPKDIEEFFCGADIAAWRLAILNSIGLPKLAKRSIIVDSGRLQDDYRLWHESRALFHEGKYFTAAQGFIELAAQQRRRGHAEQAANTMLDASDAFRAGGAMTRAWGSLYAAHFISPSYDRAKYLLKRSLLLNDIVDGLRIARPLSIVRQSVRLLLKRSLRACAQAALSKGSRLDFQQVGLLAHRAGISLSALEQGDFYPPPEPSEGYQHLGYYVAKLMCLTDEYRSTPLDGISEEKKIEILLEFSEHIRKCDVMGLVPGAWKLLAIQRDLALRGWTGSAIDDERLSKYFLACEYSWLMRRLQARRYGYTSTRLIKTGRRSFLG